jgi:hypothetical protein
VCGATNFEYYNAPDRESTGSTAMRHEHRQGHRLVTRRLPYLTDHGTYMIISGGEHLPAGGREPPHHPPKVMDAAVFGVPNVTSARR